MVEKTTPCTMLVGTCEKYGRPRFPRSVAAKKYVGGDFIQRIAVLADFRWSRFIHHVSMNWPSAIAQLAFEELDAHGKMNVYRNQKAEHRFEEGCRANTVFEGIHPGFKQVNSVDYSVLKHSSSTSIQNFFQLQTIKNLDGF